jgi:hypothetical protein
MQRQRFNETGFWRGEAWEPQMGVAGLKARRKACGGSLWRCTGRRPWSQRWLLVLLLCAAAAGLLVAAKMTSAFGYSSLLPTVVRTGR